MNFVLCAFCHYKKLGGGWFGTRADAVSWAYRLFLKHSCRPHFLLQTSPAQAVRGEAYGTCHCRGTHGQVEKGCLLPKEAGFPAARPASCCVPLLRPSTRRFPIPLTSLLPVTAKCSVHLGPPCLALAICTVQKGLSLVTPHPPRNIL